VNSFTVTRLSGVTQDKIKMANAGKGFVYLFIDEAADLYRQLGAALGDDTKADLLAAALAVVDQAIIADNLPGYVCIICGETGERSDLIQHEPGCCVGMAMAAAVRAKGEE